MLEPTVRQLVAACPAQERPYEVRTGRTDFLLQQAALGAPAHLYLGPCLEEPLEVLRQRGHAVHYWYMDDSTGRSPAWADDPLTLAVEQHSPLRHLHQLDSMHLVGLTESGAALRHYADFLLPRWQEEGIAPRTLTLPHPAEPVGLLHTGQIDAVFCLQSALTRHGLRALVVDTTGTTALYPLQHCLYGLGDSASVAQAAPFVEWLGSPEAQQILTEAGLRPTWGPSAGQAP